MKNILIADHTHAVRIGIASLLQEIRPKAYVHHAKNFKELVLNFTYFRFDLLILDIDIPGCDSHKLIEEALQLQSDLQILIFTKDEYKFSNIVHLMPKLSGYLSKTASIEQLSERLMILLNEDINAKAEKLKSGDKSKNCTAMRKRLSKREVEIAHLLLTGTTLFEIAKKLQVHRTTVSTYKRRLFKKIGVSSLAELVHVTSFTSIGSREVLENMSIKITARNELHE